MKVIIDNYTFEAELAPNATAETFARFLPLELEMSDLNNNEKYFYTAARIPRTEYLPGHIDCGDIMLWEADCIVVFYKRARKYPKFLEIAGAWNRGACRADAHRDRHHRQQRRLCAD